MTTKEMSRVYKLVDKSSVFCKNGFRRFVVLIFDSVYYTVLSSNVLRFYQPLRRFKKATLISSRTYIAFSHNVHCALEDFLINPGKTGRSCSFSRTKISRRTSGTRVHKIGAVESFSV